MCGIAGFIENKEMLISKADSVKTVTSMLEAIKHRGPDDWGISTFGYNTSGIQHHSKIVFEDSYNTKLVLGHRRLSIIDLSESGRQPFCSDDKKIWITYNGEIYNYIKLKNELKSQYQFRTNTDTEVLIAAYRIWGIDFLKKIDGMYSFALWDTETETLLCARDPFSIKPFYYHISKGKFIFASEPKAIICTLEKRPTVNIQNTSDFILFGASDHNNGTFFKEINQLEGGYFMQVKGDLSSHKIFPFWEKTKSRIEISKDIPLLLNKLLVKNIKEHIQSDVAVGGCLSGGIDSGAIACILKDILGEEINSFKAITFSSPGFKNDETDLASLTAKTTGVDWHKVISDKDELVYDLPKLVDVMGEPFSTLSIYAQYKVMQKAKELGIKVMLDGQGGDEVFVGYPRVANLILKEDLLKLDFSSFFQDLKGFKKHASLTYLQQVSLNFMNVGGGFITYRNKNRIKPFIEEAILDNYNQKTIKEIHGGGIMEETQYNELKRYVIPRLLRFEDRNSMAFSIEARVPMLSKEIVEFGLNLPSEWKVNNGWTKYALRYSMQGKLPAKVLWDTQKKGFDIPQQQWMKSLSSLLKNMLPKKDNGIIKTENLIEAINHGNAYQPHIWRCISVGLWMNQHKVKI